MAPTKDVKVKPLFLRTRDLPYEDISTREICGEAEKVTGYDTMEGAQRIGGLWRIYPKTHAARLQLRIDGLKLRNVHLSFLDENPFLVKSGHGDGTRVETTKVFISNIPISFSNVEIENKMMELGCKPVSKLIEECDRDEHGKLTRWKTGRRFVFIEIPSAPLPTQVSVGMFTARLFHKEQKLQAGSCSNCLQDGHRKHECQSDVVCRHCKKTGHKRGDDLCEATSGKREATLSSQREPAHDNIVEETEADDESSSGEGSRIREEKNKEKSKKRGRKEDSPSGSDEEARCKMPNTNESPTSDSLNKRPSDTDREKSTSEDT